MHGQCTGAAEEIKCPIEEVAEECVDIPKPLNEHATASWKMASCYYPTIPETGKWKL